MFSLIITIISIALVAALALATIYYGGSAFNKGSAGAKASQLINEGQQVNGAVAIYLADLSGNSASTLTDNGTAGTQVEDLAPAYLSQVPATFALAAETTNVVAGGHIAVASDALVCAEVNKRAGVMTAPADVAASTTVYGCTTGNTFFYKF